MNKIDKFTNSQLKANPPQLYETLLSLATTTLFLAGHIGARAQIADTWSTFDGGSGSSSSLQFAISGTAGQADAGVLSGGPYILHGGFWTVVATFPPRLIISYSAGVVTICWPYPSSGYVLEQSNSLTAPVWLPVTTAPSQIDLLTWCVTEPASPSQKFYRITKKTS